MSDRDDAPPAQAVEAMRWAIVSRMQSNGTTWARGGLRALRTLPAAALVDLLAWLAASLPERDRWRAAARLADRLEPTREMAARACDGAAETGSYRHAITAALAAAREAGDAE